MARRNSASARTSLNLLGPKLRNLRLDAGLSQSDLVGKLQRGGWDCEKMTISRIERGERTVTDVELAMILKKLRKKWTDLD